MPISIGASQMFCAQAAGFAGPAATSRRSWANSIGPISRASSAANPSAARQAVRAPSVRPGFTGSGLLPQMVGLVDAVDHKTVFAEIDLVERTQALLDVP